MKIENTNFASLLPSAKRRKLEATHKRKEVSYEAAPPTKRPKISVLSEDVEMRDIPVKIPKLPHPSSKDRFIPSRDRINQMIAHAPENWSNTERCQHLAGALLGTRKPCDEKVFSFTGKATAYRHPYNPSTHSIDEVEHPKLKARKSFKADGLKDDFYHQALAYSKSSDSFAVILDGKIYVNGHEIPDRYSAPPTSLAFTPDGKGILAAMKDGALFGYNLTFTQNGILFQKTYESFDFCNMEPYHCHQLLISNSAIFIGSANGRLSSIDLGNPNKVCDYLQKGGKPILGLALSPDGKSLLAMDNEGIISLFDTDTHKLQSSVKIFLYGGKALAFSPCGRYFVAGGGLKDPRVILFSIQDGVITKKIDYDTKSQVTALFWQNQFVLSTHRDGLIRSFGILPKSINFMSPPKIHLTPQKDIRQTFAALKSQRNASDQLLIGCPGAGVILNMEINMPCSEPPRRTIVSRYDTIR